MCGECGVCACSGEKSAKQKRHKKKGNSRTGALHCWLQFSENDLVCLIGRALEAPRTRGVGLGWLALLFVGFFLKQMVQFRMKKDQAVLSLSTDFKT